jgi:beta-lactamase class A
VVALGPGTLGELMLGLVWWRSPSANLAVPPSRPDPELQARLNSAASSLGGGTLAVAVTDLHTGATATINAERAYPAASLFKLPLLVEVLAQIETGRLDPERRLEIRPEDWTDGSGVLQARVGERLTVGELTRLMIHKSDNIAALVLLDAVGLNSINTTADRLGLHATRLVDHRAGDPGEHTTSAADMVQLFVTLASGRVVNQHASEEALSLLQLEQSVNWLSEGLPFWVKVAHKWGDLPQVRNDAGIVFTPRGAYAIAVLTQGSTPEAAAAAIGRLSRAAYDLVGSRPAPR